jgi:hypothetical protein
MIEVKDLAQLDRAFDHVAERSEATEGYHFGVNSLVQNVRFALYRDFPDPQRQRGAEREPDEAPSFRRRRHLRASQATRYAAAEARR